MADRKISDLTALTTPASGDYLPIVDISEASAANKNKRITIEELLRGAPNGTAGAPSFAFESDPDTGLYSTGANAVAISTGGTGRIFVDSSGRVGVGATSPSYTLDVSGSARVKTGATGTPFIVSTGGDSQGTIRFGSTSFEYSINGGADYLGLVFNTGGSESARIDSSGRLGIGTTSPGYLLDVRRSSAGDVVAFTGSTDGGRPLKFVSADNGIFLGAQWTRDIGSGSGIHAWAINGTERARITSSGQLLVGTSSARSPLTHTPSIQVEGLGYATSTVSVISNSNDTNGAYSFLGKSRGTSLGSNTVVQSGDEIGGLDFIAADGTQLLRAARITALVDGTPGANDMPGRLVFATTADGASSPTERMRIANKGNITITSVADNDAALRVDSNGTSGAQYGIYIETGNDQNDATRTFLGCVGGATTRAQIRSNGGFANYQANDVNLSDRNVKKDISLAAGTWDCIKEWEIVNYRYKDQPDDADLNLGVIAQQVAESCPEVITVFEEAKDDQPEKLGVKEQQMYWMAIKALQEAQVRIEQLEAKVAALESA